MSALSSVLGGYVMAKRKGRRPQLNVFLDRDVFDGVENSAAAELQTPSRFGKLLFMYAWQEYKRCGSLKQLYARPVKPLRRG